MCEKLRFIFAIFTAWPQVTTLNTFCNMFQILIQITSIPTWSLWFFHATSLIWHLISFHISFFFFLLERDKIFKVFVLQTTVPLKILRIHYFLSTRKWNNQQKGLQIYNFSNLIRITEPKLHSLIINVISFSLYFGFFPRHFIFIYYFITFSMPNIRPMRSSDTSEMRN